jgi:hypothetical protein
VAFSALGATLLRYLPVFTVALAIFGYPTLESSARTRIDGPEVTMASTKRDFGDVFAGEELEQTFPVRNNGTKPLELAQRSTLGTRSTTSSYLVTAAVWRSGDNLLTRSVAARRAAPS